MTDQQDLRPLIRDTFFRCIKGNSDSLMAIPEDVAGFTAHISEICKSVGINNPAIESLIFYHGITAGMGRDMEKLRKDEELTVILKRQIQLEYFLRRYLRSHHPDYDKATWEDAVQSFSFYIKEWKKIRDKSDPWERQLIRGCWNIGDIRNGYAHRMNYHISFDQDMNHIKTFFQTHQDTFKTFDLSTPIKMYAEFCFVVSEHLVMKHFTASRINDFLDYVNKKQGGT